MDTIFRKISLAIFSCILLVLLSCSSNNVFKQFDRFEDNRWAKTDLKTYNFTINKEAHYNLILDFSHISETPLNNIPIKVAITSQSGETENITMILHLKDENGKDVADCGGDYCDFEQEIFKDRQLTTGDYKVVISNEFDYEYTPNVIGVGIEVNTSE